MKLQWKSVSPEQERRNSLLHGYRSLIGGLGAGEPRLPRSRVRASEGVGVSRGRGAKAGRGEGGEPGSLGLNPALPSTHREMLASDFTPGPQFPVGGGLVTMASEDVASVKPTSLHSVRWLGTGPHLRGKRGEGAAANGQQGWGPQNVLTLAPCTLSPQRET